MDIAEVVRKHFGTEQFTAAELVAVASVDELPASTRGTRARPCVSPAKSIGRYLQMSPSIIEVGKLRPGITIWQVK